MAKRRKKLANNKLKLAMTDGNMIKNKRKNKTV
jgi:hypothetical protein